MKNRKNAVIFSHEAVSSPCHTFKGEIIYAIPFVSSSSLLIGGD